MTGDFAKLFLQFRLHAGLSQRALAKIAGFDDSFLSRIESNARVPTKRDDVRRLARAMDLSPEDEDRLLVAAGFAPYEVRSLLVEPVLADLDAVIALLPGDMRDQVRTNIRGVIAYANQLLAEYEGRVA